MIRILILLLLSATSAMAQYRPDILGEGFEQRTIDLPDEGDGDLRATLVRALPMVESSTAILYIHGYNDYFFQSEMARRFNDSLYNFYALDLRRYGRSVAPEQDMFRVEDMSDYFTEIAQAVEIAQEEGAERVFLMGHSTGGLTVALYAMAQQRDGATMPHVDGLILNSPFLDMNLPPFTESVLVPIAARVGEYLPDITIFKDHSTSYYESVDRDHNGEWKYDTTLKPINLTPTKTGWVRAIHNAQMAVQDDPKIEIPILLMHSDKSLIAPLWVPGCQTSDIVLDVNDMSKYGETLGEHVTHVVVEDGMHDLVLSKYESRESVYFAIFEWLSRERSSGF